MIESTHNYIDRYHFNIFWKLLQCYLGVSSVEPLSFGIDKVIISHWRAMVLSQSLHLLNTIRKRDNNKKLWMRRQTHLRLVNLPCTLSYYLNSFQQQVSLYSMLVLGGYNTEMFCGENVGKFGQHGSVHILERERVRERESHRDRERGLDESPSADVQTKRLCGAESPNDQLDWLGR